MIIITVKALDKTIFKLYNIYINKILQKLQLKFSRINLPLEKKRISLLKSPHVNKKAIEQFEIHILKSCIQIRTQKLSSVFRHIVINKPKSISLQMKRIV